MRVADAASPDRTAAPRVPAALGIVFGCLSALGALSIDLYLPAFPLLAGDLAASPSEVQLTLTMFIVALACGQLFYGSLSDRYGRRPLLFFALAIFVAGSIGAAQAPGIGWLIAFRFVQGLGACGTTMLSRAMIGDLAHGAQAARLIATSFLILGISPVVAPIAGGFLIGVMPWRALFHVMAAAGVLLAIVVALRLPETRPPRTDAGPGALAAYRALLADRGFLAASAVAGASTGVVFGFLTAAPFAYSHHYQLPPQSFALLLAGSAVCQIGAVQLAPALMRRYGPGRHLAAVSGAGLLVALAWTALTLAGAMPLALFVALAIVATTLAGLLLPVAAAGALDAGKAVAGGAAAAVLGTVQLIVSGACSAIATAMAATSLLPGPLVVLIAFAIAVAAVRFRAAHA